MNQIYNQGEGKWERWEDYVQRLLFWYDHMAEGREDWDFDDWTGGVSEFSTVEAYEEAKRLFEIVAEKSKKDTSDESRN